MLARKKLAAWVNLVAQSRSSCLIGEGTGVAAKVILKSGRQPKDARIEGKNHWPGIGLRGSGNSFTPRAKEF